MAGSELDKIKQDFSFLKDEEEVLAVLLYGSKVTGRDHERSDTDVCIVAPEADTARIMSKVWKNISTGPGKYDVHTFEEFGLKMKHQVIKRHEVVWYRDEVKLKEYLHRFRRLWNDQSVARGIT